MSQAWPAALPDRYSGPAPSMPGIAGFSLPLPGSLQCDQSPESPDYAAKTGIRYRDCRDRRSVSRLDSFLSSCRDGRLARPAERSSAPPATKLFLLLLLGLLRLRCRSLGGFVVRLLLALLDDFGFGRSSRVRRRRVRSRHHFFLHRGDVRHGLVRIGNEFNLVRVRQLRDAQHLAEGEKADVGVDVARNIRGQTLDLDFAQHLFHDAAFLL